MGLRKHTLADAVGEARGLPRGGIGLPQSECRRYSTMTTNPVPQPGHSLVSCELHIDAFSGFEQSINSVWILMALLFIGASPTGLPLHFVPKIFAVANPLTVTV